jgi:hypothetical protein
MIGGSAVYRRLLFGRLRLEFEKQGTFYKFLIPIRKKRDAYVGH